MDDMSFILEMIPPDIRNNLKKIRCSEGEYVSYERGRMLYLITEGEVVICRYESDRKVIFPHIFRKGELLGIRYYFMQDFFDWDPEALSEEVEFLEIPAEVMERYVFSDFRVLKRLIGENYRIFGAGFRGYYIKSQGGAVAYLAYALYINTSEETRELKLKAFSHLTDVLSVNRARLYKIIREFQEEGILTQERSNIVLHDRERLKEYFREYVYD